MVREGLADTQGAWAEWVARVEVLVEAALEKEVG